MSFDWLHYLIIAQGLFEGTIDTGYKEANLRSSISRAYYSAFHHAKQKLYDKWCISVSESAIAHVQVQSFFKQKNEKTIARKLQRMRTARNRADYDDQIAHLDDLAQGTLSLANEIIKAL